MLVFVGGWACKSKTPTAPTVDNGLSGTWSGTITDPVVGSAQVTLTLRQMNVTSGLVGASGTWQASFPPGLRTSSGIVTGFQGPPAERWVIYLDPAGFPPCLQNPPPYSTHGQGFELNVTRNANRLMGTSTFRTCSESFEGTVDLTR